MRFFVGLRRECLKKPRLPPSSASSWAGRFRRIWRNHERLSRVTELAVLVVRRAFARNVRHGLRPRNARCRGYFGVRLRRSISIVIATLLAIVAAFSCRQTIHAHPTGGGAYIVAKENINQAAGLIAAASLLVDHTLTVSVSISAGVLAITSAEPRLDVYRVEMCLGVQAILMVGNLRGIGESGRIFAVPTYFSWSAPSCSSWPG